MEAASLIEYNLIFGICAVKGYLWVWEFICWFSGVIWVIQGLGMSGGLEDQSDRSDRWVR